MKIILSRKGFDSSFGGYASPIFEDKVMISLPIPSAYDQVKYSQLHFNESLTYYDLMKKFKDKIHIKEKEWKWKLLTDETRCHLDPDIYKNIYPRDLNWKPIFGQMNAAAHHLKKEKVGVGDLFLFFGWFKNFKKIDDKYYAKGNTNGIQVIFGYLQIGEKINETKLEKIPLYAQHHAHTHEKRLCCKSNTMFVSREKLTWDENISGAGTFNFDESLVLTKEGMNRTQWKPYSFLRDVVISYHPKNSNKYGWRGDYFQSATIGQEFVIEENKQVEEWAKNLISKNVKNY